MSNLYTNFYFIFVVFVSKLNNFPRRGSAGAPRLALQRQPARPAVVRRQRVRHLLALQLPPAGALLATRFAAQHSAAVRRLNPLLTMPLT